eukprot:341872-Rhodomonas_salina.2
MLLSEGARKKLHEAVERAGKAPSSKERTHIQHILMPIANHLATREQFKDAARRGQMTVDMSQVVVHGGCGESKSEPDEAGTSGDGNGAVIAQGGELNRGSSMRVYACLHIDGDVATRVYSVPGTDLAHVGNRRWSRTSSSTLTAATGPSRCADSRSEAVCWKGRLTSACVYAKVPAKYHKLLPALATQAAHAAT